MYFARAGPTLDVELVQRDGPALVRVEVPPEARDLALVLLLVVQAAHAPAPFVEPRPSEEPPLENAKLSGVN